MTVQSASSFRSCTALAAIFSAITIFNDNLRVSGSEMFKLIHGRLRVHRLLTSPQPQAAWIPHTPVAPRAAQRPVPPAGRVPPAPAPERQWRPTDSKKPKKPKGG